MTYPKVDGFRSLVRPLLTLAAFAFWGALVWTGRAGATEFVVMATSIVSFWFGGRSDKPNGGA